MSTDGSAGAGRRTQRGRLLVVGRRLLPTSLRDRLHRPPIEVDSIFEALGEIATARAGAPIAAALIDLHGRAGLRAAEAILRLDPAVRLIGIADEATSDLDGFDEVVRLPIDARELHELLGAGLVTGTSADLLARPSSEPEDTSPVTVAPPVPTPPVLTPPVPTPPVLTPPVLTPPVPTPPVPTPPVLTPPVLTPPVLTPPVLTPPVASPPNVAPASSPAALPAVLPNAVSNAAAATPVVPDLPLPPPAEGGRTGQRPLPTNAVPPPRASSSETLGDTDLLRAVMEDPDGVRETALALIRQHSGWDDVALAIGAPDRAIDLPPGSSAIAIGDGDDDHGVLTSAIATDEQLARWARWLAQWLRLDQAFRGYREMAYRDQLTGAWNRRYFHRFLDEIIVEAGRRRRAVTVMVFDIDDFKRYNDEYSHEAGDVILCETVSLLNSVIRSCDRVCRIGGDEFAVIFADLDAPRESGSHHPASVELIARRFQAQICQMRFPKLGLEAPGNLSISAGLSAYPWDGADSASLLRLADERALESKRRGKNDITFGPGAADLCPDDTSG